MKPKASTRIPLVRPTCTLSYSRVEVGLNCPLSGCELRSAKVKSQAEDVVTLQVTDSQLKCLFVLEQASENSLSKGCHLDVVRGPSTPHDPESDAGGSLSSWQRHPSR
jgi:hypothetical protein